MMCMGLIFFGLFCLGFARLLDYVNVCLLPNSGSFQPLCLQILFVQYLKLFFSLFGTPVIQMLDLLLLPPQVPEALFILFF